MCVGDQLAVTAYYAGHVYSAQCYKWTRGHGPSHVSHVARSRNCQSEFAEVGGCDVFDRSRRAAFSASLDGENERMRVLPAKGQRAVHG